MEVRLVVSGDRSLQNVVIMKLSPLLTDETIRVFRSNLNSRIAQVYHSGKEQQSVSRRRKRALDDIKAEVYLNSNLF